MNCQVGCGISRIGHPLRRASGHVGVNFAGLPQARWCRHKLPQAKWHTHAETYLLSWQICKHILLGFFLLEDARFAALSLSLSRSSRFSLSRSLSLSLSLSLFLSSSIERSRGEPSSPRMFESGRHREDWTSGCRGPCGPLRARAPALMRRSHAGPFQADRSAN